MTDSQKDRINLLQKQRKELLDFLADLDARRADIGKWMCEIRLYEGPACRVTMDGRFHFAMQVAARGELADVEARLKGAGVEVE